MPAVTVPVDSIAAILWTVEEFDPLLPADTIAFGSRSPLGDYLFWVDSDRCIVVEEDDEIVGRLRFEEAEIAAVRLCWLREHGLENWSVVGYATVGDLLVADFRRNAE